jgi:hypothetical protein
MLPKEYFPDSEVCCKCGCGLKPNQTSLERLYALRIVLGFPLPINSGARCKAHNKAEGGKGGSIHLPDVDRVGESKGWGGSAWDVGIPRCDTNQRERLLEEAKKLGYKGFGFGETFIHIDDANRPRVIEWWYK